MKQLESLDADSWILCETRFVVDSLRQQCGASEISAGPRIFTTADAALQLIRELCPERKIRRLSHPARRTMLWRLLAEQKQFPLLCSEFSDSAIGVPSEVDRLLRFLDSVRLHQTDDQLIRSAIDEHGNVIVDRREELIGLIAAYQELQQHLAAFDGPAMLEQLLFELNRTEQLAPKQMLLYRPTRVFPLEQSVYDRLAGLLELCVEVEAIAPVSDDVDPPPSEEYLASLRHFLNYSAKRFACLNEQGVTFVERQELVNRLIDAHLAGTDQTTGQTIGQTTGQAEQIKAPRGIAVWRCRDRRDEVRRLAEAISAAIDQGSAAASDYHILAFNVEPYRSLIEAEFARREIPLLITKGRSLSQTIPADFLSQLFNWIRDPSWSTAGEFFGHPFAAVPQLDAANAEQFLQVHGQALSPLFEAERFKELRGELSPAALLLSCAHAGVRPLLAWMEQEILPLELGSTTEQLLAKLAARLEYLLERPGSQIEIKRLLAVLAGLAVFEREQQSARELRQANDSAEQLACSLCRYYNQTRLRLVELRGLAQNSVSVAAGATRQLQRLFRQAAGDFELLSFERFAAHLTEYVERTQLRVPTQTDAVRLTEFLDARTIFSPAVVLLGCSSRELNKWVQLGGAQETGELDVVTNLVNRRGRAASRLEESHWLLAQLFRQAGELVFSAPERDEHGEALPAAFLLELASLYPKGSAIAELKNLADPPLSQRAAAAEACPRALSLLKSRAATEFTEYDGQIGAESTAKLLRMRAEKYAGEANTIRLSVSALELLSQNPFQFFLQELLGLRRRADRFEAELPLYLGTIVHRCLERFFDPRRGFSVEQLRSNFPQACAKMSRLAETEFANHLLDWQAHPLLCSRKSWVLQGLHSAGEGKRGPLAAALLYQRDLLESIPHRVEYRFGLMDDTPALHISSAGEAGGSYQLEVTGCIDRIDSLPNGDGLAAIWDYKTGGSPTLREIDSLSSLQLPLYAAAVEQCLGQLPLRGGVIDLSQPNRNDSELASARKGACRELLALEPRGAAFSEQEVARRVEQAVGHAASLLELFVKGEFFQPLDADVERYQQHSMLHCRDEVLLGRKWEELTLSERPLTLNERPLTEFLQNHGTSTEQQLSTEQQAACSLEQPVCLSAGAGSGKTSVLRARVLELIRGGEPIESLLAVTFTEKAADEIRQRIEQALAAVLRSNRYQGTDLPEAERQLFVRAKSAISRAQISTLHGLAARIVGMDAQLSGLGPFNRILTGSEQQTLLSGAVRSVLNDSTARDRAEQVLNAGIHFRALEQQLQRLAVNPDLLSDIEKLISSKGSSELAQLVAEYQQRKRLALVEQYQEFFSNWCVDLSNWLADSNAKLNEEQLAAHTYLQEAISSLLEQDADRWLVVGAELRGYIRENQSLAKRKSKHTPRNFINDLRDSLDALLEQGALLATGRQSAVEDGEQQAWRLVGNVAALAAQVRGVYQQRKAARQVVDFDDLIFGAHRMLCGAVETRFRTRQAALCRRLQEQFRHIMVDEFQDTDQRQWQLLSTIAGLQADRLEVKTLFLVGDPQQSIYGFRGGDSRVFELAKAQLEQIGGISLSLDDNYRSQPKILGFVNEFFEQLFAVDYAADGRALSPTAVRAQQMRAKLSDTASEDTASEVRARVIPLWKPYVSGAGRQENGDTGESKHLVEYVKDVLESFDAEGRSERFPELALNSGSPQVAILTRTVRQLTRVAHALESAKLSFSISHSSGFYELEEIIQLQHLLRLLSDPADAISLVGVLRSPLLGLSDPQLVDLYGQLQGRWVDIWNDDIGEGELLDFVRGRLFDWRRTSRAVPCSDLLEYVWRCSGMAEAYGAVGKAEAFGNIERFIDRLSRAERSGECGLHPLDALRWLANERVSGTDAPTANSASHPVVLSTVHGAKGLEYPMVLLPFLGGRPRRDHDFIGSEIPDGSGRRMIGIRIEDPLDDFRRKKTLTMQLLEENYQAMFLSEERRIFYVACTRAQHYLVLSLREGRKFEAEQTELAELSAKQRAERCRGSDSPALWYRLFESQASAF